MFELDEKIEQDRKPGKPASCVKVSLPAPPKLTN